MSRRQPPPPPPTNPLQSAFDELRFGRERTLNLRELMPTGEEAARRAELWLRERQVARSGEVLLITGRGRGSAGGIPVVRQAINQLLQTLHRQNVVAEWREHSPGAFVVQLASVRALYEAPKLRVTRVPKKTDPAALAGLDDATRVSLRALAMRSLDDLGVAAPSETLVHDEMVRQFTDLAALVPRGPAREAALRTAVERALRERDDDA